jgi:hypothetical protein
MSFVILLEEVLGSSQNLAQKFISGTNASNDYPVDSIGITGLSCTEPVLDRPATAPVPNRT